jgi:hypothetical protein
MNTVAQCWKQNAPQTGVSEGRILLWQELQLTVGELGCGPDGRRWDDHAPSLHQSGCACNHHLPGVDAEPGPGQTDRENGPKVRRELTGRPAGSDAANLDPDPVPSARMLGSELKDSERNLMPKFCWRRR